MRSLLAALLMLPVISHAVPVSFELHAPSLWNQSDPLFASAETLTLRFTYETTATDTDPDPIWGRYDALTAVSVFVDDLELVGSDFGLFNIRNDENPDATSATDSMNFLTGLVAGGGYSYSLQFYSLYLDGPYPGMWNSDALTGELPMVFPFETQIILRDLVSSDILGAGYVSDWAQVPVPEPASLGLFALALGGLGLMRRRRTSP